MHTLATICRTRNPDGTIPEPAKESMRNELRNVIKYRTWEPVLPTVKVDKIIRSLMMAVQKFTATGDFAKWKGLLVAMENKLEFEKKRV